MFDWQSASLLQALHFTSSCFNLIKCSTRRHGPRKQVCSALCFQGHLQSPSRSAHYSQYLNSWTFCQLGASCSGACMATTYCTPIRCAIFGPFADVQEVTRCLLRQRSASSPRYPHWPLQSTVDALSAAASLDPSQERVAPCSMLGCTLWLYLSGLAVSARAIFGQWSTFRSWYARRAHYGSSAAAYPDIHDRSVRAVLSAMV